MRVNLQQLTESIYAADRGPDVVAFFDFDKTLIAGYSAQAFMWQQLKTGKLGPKQITNLGATLTRYSRGGMGFSDFVAESSQFMTGQTEAQLAKEGDLVYKKSVAGSIYPEARELLAAHKSMGHTIAVVSSATKHQIAPAAKELGIEHIMCTELEMVDGVFTGNVISPTCFGEGKRIAAEKFCVEHKADLGISFFYTDSEDDLPLSKAVGNSRIVNPSKTLAKIAKEEDWPVCDFTDRGRPSLVQMAKMGSVYYMMPAAMTMALPIWALTGNKRSAVNTGMSLWADYASALTGLKYDIEGEDHLWEQRPAVFIFNHQSAADTVIISKLLRRDFTGIGKKEIKKMPIVGQMMQFADVVFIDRENSKSAIDAMKPVVDAIKKDGLSVTLAPEGTRSYGNKLGVFKKGAFHIAMQAGVPIIPIVIHNAADTLPRGRQIAKPANIRVTVLPPVDTSDWTFKNMNKQVKSVRDQFLKVLGQT